MNPTFLSASRTADLARARAIGGLELVDHFIARAERLNPRINAVAVRDFDRARDRAPALDAWVDRSAPLFGVPMTIKESCDVAGLPTTWDVPEMRGSIASTNAVAVDRLLAAGAVMFGKTSVPLMLNDLQTFNELCGTTNSPWDLTRSPPGAHPAILRQHWPRG
jgi:amidase